MSGRIVLGDMTLDELLDALADRVADALEGRVADRVLSGLAQPSERIEDRWLTTRDAAQHLGMHTDTLRKLAAARKIPHEQEGRGCALYFQRSALDRWREAAGHSSDAGSGASTRLPRIGKAA